MDAYNENLSSCLLFRNKQLTKELKRFEDLSALSVSSSQMLALSQLLKLHLAPLMELSGMNMSGRISLQ